MKKEKKNKKNNIIMILLLLIIFGSLAFLLYGLFGNNAPYIPLEVKITNAQISPEFEEGVYEYNVYTSSQTINISCNKEVRGCNKEISVDAEKKLEINYNGDIYTFNIIILEVPTENETVKIEILEINGNPSKWVKETTLDVLTYNPKNEKIEYSFDGGKTWQNDSKLKITKNGLYTIKIRDSKKKDLDSREVEITKIDNTAPVVSISQEKKNNEVLLTAIANDSGSGIKSYLWSTGEKTNKITVKKNGEYSVTVEDNIGNKKEAKVNVSAIGSTTNPEKTIVVMFDSNGTTQDSISLSCTTATDSCAVTAPSITREGYTIIGWSRNKDSHTAEVKVNEQITVSANTTYYAITSKKITARFDKNGATSASASSVDCTKYNKENTCSVMLPTITRSGFTIYGWNTNKNATTGTPVGSNVNISTNITYYAITGKKVTITFNKNGNKGQIPHGGAVTFQNEITESCNYYNTNANCLVYSPDISPINNTMSVLGYTTGPKIYDNVWNANSQKRVSDNATYYAQTKKDLTATFEKNGATSISYTSKKCTIHNNETYCYVVTPTITRGGFTIHGWSSVADDTDASISVNTSTKITKDSRYFAITSKGVNVTFYRNNNSSLSTASGQTITATSHTEKCTIYNTATSCSITPPTINMNGYTIHGFSTGATTYSNYWKTGAREFNTNYKYYAQTSKTVVVTFDKNTTFDNNTVPQTSESYEWNKTNIAASSLSFYSKSCLSRNNYGCKINNAPVVYSAGNEVKGFSRTPAGGITYVSYYTFKQDTTMYARIYNGLSHGNYNCANCSGTPTQVGNFTVEFESGTFNSSKRTELVRFMNKVYAKIPQLFYNRGKIRGMSTTTFQSFWGENWGGVTGSYLEYPFVDMPYYSMDHFKGALVHELGHALDRYYHIRSGRDKAISDEDDIIQLVDDCNADPNQCGFVWNQPNNATNRKEFVANMFHVYYYNIADSDGTWVPSNPEKMNMSNRLRNIVLKYLGIVANFPNNLAQ